MIYSFYTWPRWLFGIYLQFYLYFFELLIKAIVWLGYYPFMDQKGYYFL